MVAGSTRTTSLLPVGERVPDVRRIAVLRSNSIGDFVLGLPALDALRAAYPAAQITYLGTSWHPELLEGRPGPWDRVVVVPPYPGVRGDDEATRGTRKVETFFEQQCKEHYDLAVQLHGGGGNSNPFVTRLGARVSVGSRDVDAAPLDRWIRYVYYQHEVLRFLEVVALVGAAPVQLEPRLEVTSADRAAAGAALPAGGAPLVAVHPGANDPRRRWPLESFATVADTLADRGAEVVLIGVAEDAPLAAGIVAAMRHRPVNLAGRLPLPATLGVLERSVVLLGNDSGPRHLAAAVGTATVGVYWCGNLINAGPLTRARHRAGVSFTVNCPVCGADQGHGRCDHDPSFVADVPVEDIARHAVELYESEVTTPAG